LEYERREGKKGRGEWNDRYYFLFERRHENAIKKISMRRISREIFLTSKRFNFPLACFGPRTFSSEDSVQLLSSELFSKFAAYTYRDKDIE
jgi:hypothetical protein